MSSRDRLRRAIDRGEVVRLLPDCYVAAQHSASFWARADAALAWAGDGAAVGGMAALFLHRATTSPPTRITLTVPRERRRRPPAWISLTRISYDVSTARVSGMQVATAGFALAQAFGTLAPGTRTETAYGVLRRGPGHVEDLCLALATMPRVAERRRLTRIASAAMSGAESRLEELGLTEVFGTAEFSGLIRQHTVVCAGRRWRLDLYDPASRTAIELDGAATHGSPAQRQADIGRDAALASVGIQTVRFGLRGHGGASPVVPRGGAARSRGAVTLTHALRVRWGALTSRITP
ncbi:hypothetical protein [Demequina litorisediminis]|uniref:DUF559 domain-containing protein n=1 Tax=Demequina litorisediminis TaxID=1849022 RepID=A0ABQ6IJI9_9MICO|nr:hypothetical protein [Demequina litorisediminis]GMA36869.1 hypothetical protein GCM10025876_30730 [Demequina litorisediminis]